MKSVWIKTALALVIFPVIFSCNNGKKKTTDTQYNDNTASVFQRPQLSDITAQIVDAPEDASLYYRRGQILRSLEADSMAMNDFKKAISLDSSKAVYYSAVGATLFDAHDLTGSLPWIKKAIELDPKDPGAHIKLAWVCHYMKDYKGALRETNLVQRQQPNNPESYFIEAMVFKDQNDTSMAIAKFNTVINNDPNYTDAYMQLAQLYASRKDSIALRYYDNAYKSDTTDATPLFAKGVFFQKQNNFKRAKEMYHDCILHDEQFSEAYYNMGVMYLAEDSVQKALRNFDLVTKVTPNDADAYYMRGTCFEKMNKKMEAANDYQQALIFDKEHAEARTALSRVQK